MQGPPTPAAAGATTGRKWSRAFRRASSLSLRFTVHFSRRKLVACWLSFRLFHLGNTAAFAVVAWQHYVSMYVDRVVRAQLMARFLGVVVYTDLRAKLCAMAVGCLAIAMAHVAMIAYDVACSFRAGELTFHPQPRDTKPAPIVRRARKGS